MKNSSPSVLPIYQAVSFDFRIEKGGRTRPIVVTVATQEGLRQFVVKLYNPQEVNVECTVGREVLTAALAEAFDLAHPAMALIQLTSDVKAQLPSELQLELSQKGWRPFFGTEYLYGSDTYSPELSSEVANSLYQIDTIFAFDALLYHHDRRVNKPNLLLQGRQVYLIDHEHSLNVNPVRLTEFEDGKWGYPVESHVFFDLLKDRSRRTKESYFETFHEYLRRLRPDELDKYMAELHRNKFPFNNFDFLKHYLSTIIQNSSKFVTLLRGTLQ